MEPDGIEPTTSCLQSTRSPGRRTEDGEQKTDKIRRPPGGARRDRTDDLMLAKHALSQLSYSPVRKQKTDDRGQMRMLPSSVVCFPSSGIRCPIMVGLGGLEPPTSRLSSARSNQLSYKPEPATRKPWITTKGNPKLPRTKRSAKDRPGRKRNEGGGVPHRGSD